MHIYVCIYIYIYIINIYICYVYFLVPPEIIEGPGQQEGVEGHDASLYCSANGKPVPKYEFFKVSV